MESALSQSADFRDLAEIRAREAKLLLDGSEWSGAYYLIGYAVECALKACLTKNLRAYHMPDKDIVTKGFTHDIAKLTQAANLTGARDLNAQADSDFALKWNVVLNWDESSRYVTWTETQAKELYEAVIDANHGVLPWLRKLW
jgi:HEPN domain-containing protein